MDLKNRVYLDYAGAGQPSPVQIANICAEMQNARFLSNPHSRHLTSQTTTNIIERARKQVLEHFHAECDYEIVFTASTTQSLKLLAESFLFEEPVDCIRQPRFVDALNEVKGESLFGYLVDSHTSVVGMRQVVRSDCVFCAVTPDEFTAPPVRPGGRRLFVLTAMSNFCGRKYDLRVVGQIQKDINSFVCLDAAALVSCCSLDLSSIRPDFVALSFYKIFGYPTGLGALLVRKDRIHLLEKRYYGGGSVDISHPSKPFVHFRDKFADRFEDGTINYCAIASLRHGFDDLARFGGIEQIGKHTFTLTHSVAQFLKNLKHANGNPVAFIYGSEWLNESPSLERQGGIVNFNLLRDNGDFVGYVEVEKMCDLFHIDLRTGCFCNQGACMKYLDMTDGVLMENYESGKMCGDKTDLIDGRPTGSVRISFGRMSSQKDLDVFMSMINSCFVRSHIRPLFPECISSRVATLSAISIFPIKSCGAFRINDSWKLSETGLQYDRRWMIIGADGVPITQKRTRALCFIRPSISDESLIISDADNTMDSLELPLDQVSDCCKEYIVCKDSVFTSDCGEKASIWLESLNSDEFRGCKILRQVDSGCRRQCRVSTALLNLSNEAPFLLINRASAAYLADIVGLSTEEVITRFRANFVIDCESPFDEDEISEIHIGNVEFEVIAKCTRCQMICIDQESGLKDPSLLLALRDHRIGDRMTFGLYLRHREPNREKSISVGSSVKLVRRDEPRNIN